MQASPGLKSLIRGRIIARVQREQQQQKLWEPEEDFHETIRLKLDGLNDSNQFWNFTRCGHEQIYKTCKHCGRFESLKYRCNIKWCPNCQQRITNTRRRLIELWTQKIVQPKHLVLTQQNFHVLTRRSIRQMIKSLARLRRHKCFAGVHGGCISIEITNEGNGWHLHSHWLIDAKWLDMPEISRAWAALVGQKFAICKVKDCRGKDYLQEITKYVAKGSEIASWPPETINEFVTAIRGLRFFFAFGSLHALAPAIRRELQAQKPPPPICECGESDFVYESETNAVLHELREINRRRRS